MAELSTVARPYAEALFAAARDDKTLGTSGWLDLINEMDQIAVHPDAQRVLSDPKVSDAQRVEIFLGLVRSPMPPSARNFIQLLVENDRLMLVPEIAAQFVTLKNRYEGAAAAEITSAFPMSDAQIAELITALEKKFGLKLKPHVTVDASLIGGVRVAVGDQVLDTSVQAQLARMRDTLAA